MFLWPIKNVYSKYFYTLFYKYYITMGLVSKVLMLCGGLLLAGCIKYCDEPVEENVPEAPLVEESTPIPSKPKFKEDPVDLDLSAQEKPSKYVADLVERIVYPVRAAIKDAEMNAKTAAAMSWNFLDSSSKELKDTLEEGEMKTYSLDGVDYEVDY